MTINKVLAVDEIIGLELRDRGRNSLVSFKGKFLWDSSYLQTGILLIYTSCAILGIRYGFLIFEFCSRQVAVDLMTEDEAVCLQATGSHLAFPGFLAAMKVNEDLWQILILLYILAYRAWKLSICGPNILMSLNQQNYELCHCSSHAWSGIYDAKCSGANWGYTFYIRLSIDFVYVQKAFL